MSAGATGVGSLPGGDAREAAKTVTGSFEEFPYLAELPARGPGADMIGRSLGLLVDMYAHVEPSGWRISDRPGRDSKRSRSWLGEDLDALEEFTQGYTGKLKVQAVGPWTLAAALELHGGEAMPRTREPAGTWPDRWPRACASTWPTYASASPGPRSCCSSTSPP